MCAKSASSKQAGLGSDDDRKATPQRSRYHHHDSFSLDCHAVRCIKIPTYKPTHRWHLTDRKDWSRPKLFALYAADKGQILVYLDLRFESSLGAY